MSLWPAIITEFINSNSVIVSLSYIFTLFITTTAGLQDRRGILAIGMMVFLHLILVPISASLRISGAESYPEVKLVCLFLGAMAVISMVCMVLFRVILYKIHINAPRILQDLINAGSTIVVFFVLASQAGYNLTGLIATSAVLTAVIGFSLQDTLGNIMGGLALQMDNSIQLGDWIKIDDKYSGRVTEIRWRHTSIETRNWETLIIPNSALMKGQVMVMGRRTGKPIQWRRWVYFNVDFRYTPTEVIRVVLDALHSASIDNIAKDPPINCILMDLSDSYARYAVRYWLTDIAADDPTDSEVRIWIYFALKRAGIPISIPAHALFVTEESSDRKAEKIQAERGQRIAALVNFELFKILPQEVLERLSLKVHRAPFTEGEIITRQGSEPHWLYIILKGIVSVNVYNEDLESEVARLGEGDFFGEMSIMTGERRSATVIALTDVLCLRIDKDAFQEIIQQYPEIAEHIAKVLAERKAKLDSVKINLDKEVLIHNMEVNRKDILGKIKNFFGLS
jgi:small-conductance mechanosensitive channel/CRP-like cAMP-binding protein